MAKRNPNLRAYVKFDKLGQVVPGSLILRYSPPESGRSFFWKEITNDECCALPMSNFAFLSPDGNDEFVLSVDGATIEDTTTSASGTFAAGAGQSVVVTVTGDDPTKTLLVVDDTTGVILSNQVGTTGTLTYTFTSAGDVYTIIAHAGPTTTTTTTTTSTSTSTTTTTTTSTTSTTTTTTTT